MAKPSSRWVDVVIAVGVVATVVRLWGANPFESWLNPPAPLLKIGQRAPLLVSDSDSPDRTLVLFVDSACPACRASVEFYGELTRLAQENPPSRVIALVPADRVEPTRQWLDDSGLSNVAIVPISNPGLAGLVVTPTLALVDRGSTIEDIALGKLSLAEQDQVIQFAFGDRGSPLNKTPVELSRAACGEATGSRTTQLLEVRARDEFRDDASPRVKRIPFEELGLRAMAELERTRRVVVLSRSSVERGRQAAIELRMMGFPDVGLCRF